MSQLKLLLLLLISLRKNSDDHHWPSHRDSDDYPRADQIIAIPTLVRKLPAPMRKIIGDLSNTERVLVGLDVRPVE